MIRGDMKERIKRKQLSAVLGILVILSLFLGVVLLSAAIHMVSHTLKAAGWDTTFMPYIEYLILILVGLLIVTRWLPEYEYTVIDDELYIDRYLGRRFKNLTCIRLSEIVSIGKSEPDIRQKARFTFKSKNQDVVYIVFKQDGQNKCGYFSPSKELLELIEKRIAN